MREQPLLHHVLQAARRTAAAIRSFSGSPRPATPSPDRDEQIEPLDAARRNPRASDRRASSRSRTAEQTVRTRALQRELCPRSRQLCDHRAAAGLLPQPLEHQHGPSDGLRSDPASWPRSAPWPCRKARTRAHQPFQLTAPCNSSKRPSVAITCWRTWSPSRGLDDLQIGAPGRVCGGSTWRRSACLRTQPHRAKKSNQIN